ncbi:MAG: putative selenocysteine system protein [Promethearchaeota archaeon]
MENQLLNQFNAVITAKWPSTQIEVSYDNLTQRELFELAYHTCNSVKMRSIQIKLTPSENKGGSQAVFYSNTKKFIIIEALENILRITKYYPEGSTGDKLNTEIHPKLKIRKSKFASKDDAMKTDLLKTILVERKLDECSNFVVLKDINRKVYFAIGDARESAAVVPMFMEAEGASLVQLALNKWMSTVQTFDQEKPFPTNSVTGLLKNLVQIKKWVLNLISINLDK